MSGEDKWSFVCVAFGFMVGAALMIGTCRGYYRMKAIENGAAYYHQTTGIFKWKNDK